MKGLLGRDGCLQHSRQEIREPLAGVHQFDLRQGESHRIHREVSPKEIRLQGVPKDHLWFSTRPVIGVSAVGGDFDAKFPYLSGNRAKLSPHIPGGFGQRSDYFFNLVWARGGGEIEIIDLAPQKGIPDRSSHER